MGEFSAESREDREWRPTTLTVVRRLVKRARCGEPLEEIARIQNKTKKKKTLRWFAPEGEDEQAGAYLCMPGHAGRATLCFGETHAFIQPEHQL